MFGTLAFVQGKAEEPDKPDDEPPQQPEDMFWDGPETPKAQLAWGGQADPGRLMISGE